MSPFAPTWEWLVRRPAVGAAVGMMGGIGLHRVLPAWPGVWLGVGVGLLAGAVLFRRRGHLACGCVGLSIVAVLCAGAQLRAFYVSDDAIVHYTTDHPRLVRMRAKLTAPPVMLRAPPSAVRPRPDRQAFQVRVLSVRTLDGWTRASGLAQVSVDTGEAGLDVGQTVELLGVLTRPLPAMNPGQFDFADYSRSRGVSATVHVVSTANITPLSDAEVSFLWYLRRSAREALSKGFSEAQALDHALLMALLLGERDPIIRDVQDRFLATGTSHHLAISGMHVGVLGAFVYGLCRLGRLRPRRSAWFGMGFVGLYGLVTVPSPPVIRSVLLCMALGTGLLLRRSTDAVQLLGVILMAMLLYSPLDLYQPGFQLSFTCVLGLILLTPVVQRWLTPASTDPIARGATGRRHPPGVIRRWGRDALSVGIAAWLVSFPLVVWHFDRVNPWALFASIALGGPVFLGLVGGLLKVILTLLIPWGAGLWALAAQGPMIAMRHLAEWLSAVPGSDLSFSTMPLPLLILYYSALLTLRLPPGMLCPRLGVLRRWVRWRPAALAGMLLSLPLLPGCWSAGSRPMQLTVLSVGAGSCAVAELPDGRTLMFDAGSSTLGDPYRSVVGPFLRRRGIRSVDTLYLSHPNADHYNAVPGLLDACAVGRIAVPEKFEETCRASVVGRYLLESIERHGVPIEQLERGEVHAYGTAQVRVLWPAPSTGFNDNDLSLVLRFTCHGRSFLLPGDIQTDAQAMLLSDGTDLGGDVLVAPHHGSAESTSAGFVDATSASIIISSNDRTLTGKQRAFEQAVAGRTLYRTHETGAVWLVADREGKLEVRTFRDGRGDGTGVME